MVQFHLRGLQLATFSFSHTRDDDQLEGLHALCIHLGKKQKKNGVSAVKINWYYVSMKHL